MNWKNLSSQQQGNAGMGRAISYFTGKGLTVCLPLNDCQDYDLVVEIDGNLKKVQVKTTRFIAPSGAYQVSLVSSGGTNGTVYATVSTGSCDLLFVATESGDDYLIPKDILPSKSVNLSGKWLDYKV